MAEQCWSGEEEAVFIADVSCISGGSHKKAPLKMSITGGSHSSTIYTDRLCTQAASVIGLYTGGWLMQTASVNRPLTLTVFLYEPPM